MRVIGWDAWLLLTVFWALWFALVGVGTALVTRLPVAPVWVASMWVLQETLRAHLPFGGFPWGEIAFAQPDTPFARLAPIGGSPLVSFAVAFVGASIVTLVLDYRAGRRRARFGLGGSASAITSSRAARRQSVSTSGSATAAVSQLTPRNTRPA